MGNASTSISSVSPNTTSSSADLNVNQTTHLDLINRTTSSSADLNVDQTTDLNVDQTTHLEKINLEQVSEDEVKNVKEWVMVSNEIRIMAYGATGTGKSSLLNAIIGQELFEEGDGFDPKTKLVEEKKCNKAGVDVVTCDTPGLQDYSDNEENYLVDIQKKCINMDLFLYCIKITERRTDLSYDKSALKVITNGLGHDIWKHSVVILTFANVLEESLRQSDPKTFKKDFKSTVKNWETEVKKVLLGLGLDKKVIKNIRVVPAGFRDNLHLEVQEYWLTNLWETSLLAMKEQAQAAMVKIAYDRFCDAEDVTLEDFNSKPSAAQPLFPGYKTRVVGAVVTGSVCSVIGGLLIGIPSFGVFAGVGLAVGGAVGAAAGAHAGTAIAVLIALHRRKTKIETEKKSATNKLVSQMTDSPGVTDHPSGE